MIRYHFSKRLEVPFDQRLRHVIQGLKREGFGILTETC